MPPYLASHNIACLNRQGSRMEKSGFHYAWMSRMDIEATRDNFRNR